MHNRNYYTIVDVVYFLLAWVLIGFALQWRLGMDALASCILSFFAAIIVVKG